MGTTIRKARVEDAEQACVTLRRSIVECCIEDHRGDAGVLEAWLRNKTLENVRVWLTTSRCYAIVAENDGTVVGVASLSDEGKVLLCYLLPEFRFRRVGRAMLTALEEEARRRGLTEITLTSTRTGYAFYLRNGFADEGPESSGFGLESRRMRKILVDAAY